MGQSSPEAKKKWLEANRHKRPQINRNSRLRVFYGVSPEEHEAMFVKQDNKCAICKEEFDFSYVRAPHYPYLDHEHWSGWVRGILCRTCNFGIGQFEDSVDRLQTAIEYLISNAVPTEFDITAARAALKKKSKGNTLPRSEQHKELLRTINIGRAPWNKGKPWNDDLKVKMGKSQVSRWINATDEERERHKELGRLNALKRWGKEAVTISARVL